VKFGSLFTGIGGLDLGLERAGLECVWQVERDPWRRRILKKHWPNVRRFHDVTKFCRRVFDCEPENEDGEVICPRCRIEFGDCACIGTDQLVDEYGIPDLIAGGDPCQSHSFASNAQGATCPSLADEFVRVVDELRPDFVLRENPAAKHDAVGSWWAFRDALESLNYDVLPFRCRACCVGADFRRDRVFLFAALPITERARPQGPERAKLAQPGQLRGRSDAHLARSDRWSATPKLCRGVDGVSHRVDRIRSLGDAVVPQVGEYIGAAILAACDLEIAEVMKT